MAEFGRGRWGGGFEGGYLIVTGYFFITFKIVTEK